MERTNKLGWNLRAQITLYRFYGYWIAEADSIAVETHQLVPSEWCSILSLIGRACQAAISAADSGKGITEVLLAAHRHLPTDELSYHFQGLAEHWEVEHPEFIPLFQQAMQVPRVLALAEQIQASAVEFHA